MASEIGRMGRAPAGPGTDMAWFDVTTAWQGLPADQQRVIGAAAIAAGLGENGAMEGRRPAVGFAAAPVEAAILLGRAVAAALPGPFAEGALPDLAALGIRTCRRCGCTEQCACPDRCAWAEPDLCTSCCTPPRRRVVRRRAAKGARS